MLGDLNRKKLDSEVTRNGNEHSRATQPNQLNRLKKWLSRRHPHIPRIHRREILDAITWADSGLDELQEEARRLRDSYERLGQVRSDAGGILDRIKEARSNCYGSLLTARAHALSEGTVSLTSDDYFQFWTDMPRMDRIIFFKATARLRPEYWDEPEMKLYINNQIEQIRALKEDLKENPARQEKVRGFIGSKLRKPLQTLKRRYVSEKHPKNLIQKRVDDFCEHEFERIFIVSVPALRTSSTSFGEDQQSADDSHTLDMQKMAEIIHSQILDGLITVRVIALHINETSTVERPQDFGVVATLDEDMFAMFCDVDRFGNPQGGVIGIKKNMIEHQLDCFLKLRGYTTVIPSNASIPGIVSILEKEVAAPHQISDGEIYGNRCEMCLLRAEHAVTTGEWESEESPPIKTWYEIVAAEDKAIREYLEVNQPHGKILEVGCGPGRVLKIITELRKAGSLPLVTEVVGYEQNSDIVRSCKENLVKAGATNFDIDQHNVCFRGSEFSGLQTGERGSCGLILAVSNMVGWQGQKGTDGGRAEADWLANVIEDGLVKDGTGRLLFTVYQKGKELERARMYKAAGDIVNLRSAENGRGVEIALAVDAFAGAEHVTKAYSSNDLRSIIDRIESTSEGLVKCKGQPTKIGEYMWAVELERLAEKV